MAVSEQHLELAQVLEVDNVRYVLVTLSVIEAVKRVLAMFLIGSDVSRSTKE